MQIALTLEMSLSPFKPYNSIGKEEEDAALRVVRNGLLSGFTGAPGESFLGGPEIRYFEDRVCEYISCDHAIAVNSWSSGIFTMLKAARIGPGDEVITVAWTMSATPASIKACGATPVFVDISYDDYNIDVSKIKSSITARTKGILAVDIFGYPCNYQAIRDICDEHDMVFLVDSAQSWGATYHGHRTSCLADMGGFSLNRHKQINCGEGGIIVTNNSHYARRCQLIRNHGENCILEGLDEDINKDIVGYNFRMGEIEAAIASQQLAKLDSILESRLNMLEKLDKFFSELELFVLPSYDPCSKSSYYKYPLRINRQAYPGISRKILADTLRDNGLSIVQEGYIDASKLSCFNDSDNSRDKKNHLVSTKLLNEEDYLGLSIDLIHLDSDALCLIKSSILNTISLL